MGGKISEDDKETILAAVKEKSEWLEEHPNAEAEDYEEQLSDFQSIVSVSSSTHKLLMSLSAHLGEALWRCRWWIRGGGRPDALQSRRALAVEITNSKHGISFTRNVETGCASANAWCDCILDVLRSWQYLLTAGRTGT